jgi:hypothetical protein
MDLDINQPCPGGTGKKIKFCCKDLTRDLDKIVRLLHGGQRKAALETIDRTLAAVGDRACLFALKADALREAGDAEGAQAAMAAYADKFADNPVALAEGAIADAGAGEVVRAVDRLQSAVELSGESIDAKLYAAFGFVARALLMSGNVPAARAHLMMQIDLMRGQDPEPLQMLAYLDRGPAPLLLKLPLTLDTQAPEGAAWQDELLQAAETADRGEWRKSLQMHRALAEKHPGQAVLRHNIAVLASRLGDRGAAARAWREYAALDLSWDDRVEAEAVAQLLDPPRDEDQVDEVQLVYPIRDVDRLIEKLLSDPRFVSYPGDLRELVEEDETPPRGAYTMLDRPAEPEDAQDLTVDAVPTALGDVLVFGRRTDREPRLELSTIRGEQFETATQTLTDAAGDLIGGVEKEEATGQRSRVADLLSWRWRFPKETPPERREELMDQKRRSLIFERWPDVPRGVYDGKTPRQAAAEEKYRAAVAAAVLQLELIGEEARWGIDFNELRAQLGLPRIEPIDPAAVDVQTLPLVRYPRLQVEKLSDDDLAVAYRRAVIADHRPAWAPLCRESLGRETLDPEKIDKAQVHHLLAQASTEPKEAIEHLHACRDMLVKRGESPAPVLLEEFRLRIATGEGPEECGRIFERLRANHMNERGVAQELYQILVEFGLATPDGRMPPEAGQAAAAPQAAAPAASPPAEAGKLWTPDAPAPAAGPKKSSLWTPEMD